MGPAARPKIYLAGPDVFLGESAAIGAAKGRVCAALGLEPIYPGDTELVRRTDLTRAEIALAIFRENIGHLDRADGVIAHLSPFRGPNADDGTAFEVGYAHARGLPITAYDNAGGDLAAKTRAAAAARRADAPTDPFAVIEDFGHPANLMLACATLGPIFGDAFALPITDLSRFEQAAARMAEHFGLPRRAA